MSTYVRAASISTNIAARAALELDLPRQLRRVTRLGTGTSFNTALQKATSGKRILVTGASSGIGREVSMRLIDSGAKVLAVARRADKLEELVQYAQNSPGSVHIYPCDLSDKNQISQLTKKILSEHAGTDILINNAGKSIRRTLTETADRLHDYERVMQINFFGAVWLTVPIVEQMRGGGGHIINVSTMGTQFSGTPRFAAYMASKAALDQFAASSAPETLVDKIFWTTVHLPLVQTEMIEPAQDAWRMSPTLTVEAGASMVLDAIVRVPTRVTSPLGILVEVFDKLAPSTMRRLKSRGAVTTAE
ncbi:MAG: SDR family NAD(P)-dependent oxidoreductase [Mycobacteriaceae bacterium]